MSVSSAVVFDRFLETFDTNRDRAGERYRDLHQQLVKFFEWQSSPFAEEQADAVLDRVLRKVEAGERIANVPAYAYGVAKLLLLEERKTTRNRVEAQRHLLWLIEPQVEDDSAERQQRCFERCLNQLPPASRDIILKYYTGERRSKIDARRELAASLGMDMNALRVRAHRIRTRLEALVAQCDCG